MAMGNPRYGVMGGTFNPIHYGHLVTGEEARMQFGLNQAIFMPTGQPPHKHEAVLPAEQRYLMAVLATAPNPGFTVSRLEVDRPGPSYTIDTVRALRNQYGPSAEVFFITGADAVLEILTWKAPEELGRYCRFIAATRPGYPLEKLKELQALAESAGRAMPLVEFMEIPALAISSTDIRRRVREGRPIRYLVPEPVRSYIDKAGFYR